MHFELLENLKPDHYIKFDHIYYVISADNRLLKQINVYKNEISFNLNSAEFFSQFNTAENKEYSKKFLTDLSGFTVDQGKQYALVLLNVCSGWAIFIIKKVLRNDGVCFELYNLIRISNSVKKLFSYDLWNQFKQTVKNNVKDQNLSLAYESLLSFFLLTNLDENNFKSNVKYKEFGEVLFYFNPNSSYDIFRTSGANVIKDGLKKSRFDRAKDLHSMVEHDTVLANCLIKNVFIDL